jgi:hypothetical protein
MRISLLAAAAGLALAACAPSRPEVVPDGAGLNARLARTSSGLAVGMSEPGYVAVFTIQPGYGVLMTYPTPTRPSRVGVGWTTVLEHPRLQTAPLPGDGRTAYAVLVASRDPLDVEDFIENGARLREVLGPESALGYQRDAVMEAIEQVFGAGRGEGTWDTDIVSVPSYANIMSGRERESTSEARRQGSLQQVECTNGRPPEWVRGDYVCAPSRPPVRTPPPPVRTPPASQP